MKALFVEDLDVEVLGGTLFMELNDITVRLAKRGVILGDGTRYSYGSHSNIGTNVISRYAFLVRAPPSTQTIWPGEYLEVELPDDAPPDSEYALEPPRTDTTSARRLTTSQIWPEPVLCQV